jgi:hypothetical protein
MKNNQWPQRPIWMQCKRGRFRGVESLVSVIAVALNAAATIDDTIAWVFLQRENFGVEQRYASDA